MSKPIKSEWSLKISIFSPKRMSTIKQHNLLNFKFISSEIKMRLNKLTSEE